jgi:hypothetical protein
MRSMDQIVEARNETLEVFRDEPQDARKAAHDAAEFMLSTLQACESALNDAVTGNLDSLERAADLFDGLGENSPAGRNRRRYPRASPSGSPGTIRATARFSIPTGTRRASTAPPSPIRKPRRRRPISTVTASKRAPHSSSTHSPY